MTAEPGMETTASPSTPTDDAMIRSEEQLRVGTQRSSAGQFRLRKYIVTENVTQTVPVSHEEIRIERVPIAEANRGQAIDAPVFSEQEHEVTLYEERPVVHKEVVPVEQVRMVKEIIAGE